ncbi:MAG: hypothetical protein ACRD8A_15475 [Candidatus Acidiferrales bacterium]
MSKPSKLMKNDRLNIVREAFNHLGISLSIITDESMEEISADYVCDGIVEFDCDATSADGQRIPISIKIGRPTSRRKGHGQ